MNKKGADFELLALEFLERIFTDLGYEVPPNLARLVQD